MQRVVITALLLFVASTPALARNIPVEDLFKYPTYRDVRISPDGNSLAALADNNGDSVIVFLDLNTNQGTRVVSSKNMRYRNIMWADNDYLLFQWDNAGNESFGMASVERKGNRRIKELVSPQPGVYLFAKSANYLHRLPDDPDHVLITYNNKRVQFPDVYRLNFKSGAMVPVVSPLAGVRGYLADHSGVVRLQYTMGDRPRDLKSRIMYRSSEEADWVMLGEHYIFDEQWAPVDFTADNKNLYVWSSVGRDTAAIYLYSPEENRILEEIYSYEGYDAGQLMLTRDTREPMAVVQTADRVTQQPIGDFWTGQYAGLNAALPDTNNLIVSMSEDGQRIVIGATSDTNPGTYYLYDRAEGQLRVLAEARPWLKNAPFSPVEYISFKARDDETIHGYLIRPKNATGPTPLIVNPHGGPFGPRDVAGVYDPELQFLANRGYAVLRVNFRGSGGYGRRFENLGHRQWGLSMQDDLTDGVQWAIDQGYADPNKIAIYGASYGGYAAMVGITQQPELYKCAVNYVGVVDLPMLHEARDDFEEFDAWSRAAVGDPVSDKDQLYNTSPINFVDNIRGPVFVVHGERDPRVEIKQAKTLIKALKKEKVEHEVLLKRNEGHGFRNQNNIYELYNQMDDFLARCLK